MARKPRAGKRRVEKIIILGFMGAVTYLHKTAASFVPGIGRPNELGHACLRVARAARGGEADSFAKGDVVKAICPDDDAWYPGVIQSHKGDKYVVQWDDPEDGPETHEVSLDAIRKIVIFTDYKVGEAVHAIFPDDGNYYPGEVMKINDDGTFTVKWEDPDGGPEENVVEPSNMKYPPIPVEDLEIGQKYAGIVSTLRDFGAFVDIGAEIEGLLPVLNVATERVENIEDYLQEGQDIEVWITNIRDDGKFGLTMVEGKTGSGGGGSRPKPDLTPFADLSDEDWFDGVVRKVMAFGAFVTVMLEDGASADGLLHVSNIKDGFVDNVDDELWVGQEVQVRVLSADVSSGKMALTMRETAFASGGVSEQVPDLSPFEDMLIDTWLTGTVVRIEPYGAFVMITAEDGTQAQGLVHVTQLRNGFVENAGHLAIGYRKGSYLFTSGSISFKGS